jgi:hypothetical protein
MKAGMRGRQRFQLLLESLFTPVAHAIEEMDRAPWLLRKAPAQHAHHGRDADASADQHGGQIGIHVDVEMAGGRLHPQHVAFADPVMQMVRRPAATRLRGGARLTVIHLASPGRSDSE